MKKLSLLIISTLMISGCGSNADNPQKTNTPDIISINTLTGQVTAIKSYDKSSVKSDNIILKKLDGNKYLMVSELSIRNWNNISSLHRSENKSVDEPVYEVSVHDIQEYCSLISTKSKFKFELPTRNQWLLARGNNLDLFNGNSVIKSIKSTTQEIGSFNDVNGYYDLIGNIRELVEDGDAMGWSVYDNDSIIKQYSGLKTVDKSTRHPRNGVRLMMNWEAQ